MSEQNKDIQPQPTSRPTYTEDDLPVWEEGEESVLPPPEPIIPLSRPTYTDKDLPVWENDKAE